MGSRISVTDLATGYVSGIITPNDDMVIEGEKIKVFSEDDSSCQVAFISGSTSYGVTHRLAENNPKKVIARIPALSAGVYTLRITTRYTSGGTLLKDPRIIEFDKQLIVQ